MNLGVKIFKRFTRKYNENCKKTWTVPYCLKENIFQFWEKIEENPENNWNNEEKRKLWRFLTITLKGKTKIRNLRPKFWALGRKNKEDLQF